jgi:hypothetical protein
MSSWGSDGKRPMVQANPNRSVFADLLEAERWMTGIAFNSSKFLSAGPRTSAGSKPRNRARQNASKLLGSSGLVRREGLFCEFIEPARLDILFDLPVPLVGVMLAEPLSKSSEFGAAELLDLPFEFLDFCYAPSPPPGVSSYPSLSADAFLLRQGRNDSVLPSGA